MEEAIAQPKYKTEKFTIEFRGKKEEVTIRKCGYEEKMELKEQGIETTLTQVGNKQTADVKIHPFRTRPEAIKLCMVSGPFDPKTEMNDSDVVDVCDKIYEKIAKLNNLDESKK